LTVRWARRFNQRAREQPTGFALEQMAQLPGIYKLSDGSIPPQDSIRLAWNERAGRGSAS
jgi:hypothetical protein